MLHFFPVEFAKTLDFTGFPVISHLFTDGLMLKRPFVSYSVKLHLLNENTDFVNKIYSLCHAHPDWSDEDIYNALKEK